jgi:YHS domain-containing protein
MGNIPAMKTLLLTALLLAASPALLSAKTLVNVDRHGIGINGYDPVAYFTDTKAVKGNPAISSSADGVIYYFASPEHKASFDANPAKYEPQFGGYCAYGLSRNSLVEIDPTAFQIVNGRLLLQYSKGILEKFNKDAVANLQKADQNWPLLVEKKGK